VSYSQALDELVALLGYINSQRGLYDLHEQSGHSADAESTRVVIQRAIDQSVPFYWSPQISRTMAEVWPTMPDWRLQEESLPSRAGFFWFAEPITVPCPGENEDCADQLRALLWSFDSLSHVAEVTGSPLEERSKEVADALPDVLWLWPLIMTDKRAAGSLVSAFPWLPSVSLDIAVEAGGKMANAIDVLNSSEGFRSAVYRIFASCIAFMDQRILMASATRAERHARKRAARVWCEERAVRVIELRRKQIRPDSHADAEPVEWSHRWVVSGHWRQQWYPSLNANQPIWVMPYVKGPEDKPLKAPVERVFAVVR
jgi:hypothetical protein